MKIIQLFIITLFYTISTNAQNEPRLIIPIGHTSTINSVKLSPDGKLAVTISNDSLAKIYDAETGKELFALSCPSDILNSNFSNDSKKIILSCKYSSYTYDLNTGKRLFKINDAFSAIYSPNGKNILCSTSGIDENDHWFYEASLLRKNGKIKRKLFHFLDEATESCSFSRNGKLILIANRAGVYLYNSKRRRKVKRFDLISSNSSNEYDFISSASFSFDDKRILTTHYHSGLIKVFDIKSNKLVHQFKDSAKVNNAFLSLNGKLVISESNDSIGGNSYIKIWSIETGKVLRVLYNHQFAFTESGFSFNYTNNLFSSDGENIILGRNKDQSGYPSYPSSIVIYNLLNNKEEPYFENNDYSITSASFSGNDNYLIISTSTPDKAIIYDIKNQIEKVIIENKSIGFSTCLLSPDKKKAILETDNIINSKFISFNINNGQGIYNNLDSTIWSSLPGFNNFFSCDSKYFFNNNEVFDGDKLKLIISNEYGAFTSFDTVNNIAIFKKNDGSGIDLFHFKIKEIQQIVDERLDFVEQAKFSDDGNFLIMSSKKNIGIYTIKINDFQFIDGNEYDFLESENEIKSITFSKNNKYILIHSVVSDKYDTIKSNQGNTLIAKSRSENENKEEYVLYDISLKKNVKTFKIYSAEKIIFNKDDNLIYFKSDDIFLYDIETDSTIFIGKNIVHIISCLEPYNNTFYITTDNESLIIENKNSGLSLLDLKNLKLKYTLNNGHRGSIKSISDNGKNLITTGHDKKTILWDLKTGKKLYTRIQLSSNDWLAYDEYYRFDGTEGAINYLYLTCGLEVIDLAQVKDSLWVPGLVEKIMNGEEIKINDKPAPKLSDLNICDLTPQIEEIKNNENGIFKYKIIPSKGGLGETEIYINGNLTYSFKPTQLEKKIENKKEIYYLTFSQDSLQGYLVGKKNSLNPILVKSKVKGSGIYGRGKQTSIISNKDQETPHFYGVFIGVNEYGNSTNNQSDFRYKNLDFAKKDANDLANTVEATAKSLFMENCHIYRLTNTNISDSIPNKTNIIRVLEDISKKAKASDVLYIFFAGHGDIKQNFDEKEIRFILYNADKKNLNSTSFGIDELTEWCNPKKIKAQKRVFVFDACHSGQVINQTLAFNARGDDEASRIRQLDKLKDKNGMMILAASADNESAYEDESLNQGVLTYHLLQVIKQQQKDTSLMIRNWFDETIDLVKEYSLVNGNKQEPTSFGDGRFEIGNVNEQIRKLIKIESPKLRIGVCTFIDPFGEAEKMFPNLKESINAHFKNTSSRGNFVFSKNFDKSFRIVGTYTLIKKKELNIRYEIFFGENKVGETISIPTIKNKSEGEVIELIYKSIEKNISAIKL